MSLGSSLITRIRATDINRFNRRCALIGLAFLLVTVAAKVVRDARQGLYNMQDFPQYYMGGVIACNGAWDSLYPAPRPNLINPELGEYYDTRRKYQELAIAYHVPKFTTRYIQLPVIAIFFMPFALMPLTLAWFVWMALLIAAALGIGIQAGRIYEICINRRSHLAGILILLVCCSPQAHRWVRVCNVSAIIGWLTGLALIELVRRDGVRGAAALTFAVLTKYLLIVLGPVLLLMRRWRTIAWSMVLTMGVLMSSVLICGIDTYRTFANDVAPGLDWSSPLRENQSLYAVVLRAIGKPYPPLPKRLEIVIRVAQWTSLVAILAILATRDESFWTQPPRVFASALALLTWGLIFAPICWEHYQAYLAPLWGGIVYQGLRSRAKAVLAFAAIALTFIPLSVLFSQVTFNFLAALLIMLVLSLVVMLERDAAVADDS